MKLNLRYIKFIFGVVLFFSAAATAQETKPAPASTPAPQPNINKSELPVYEANPADVSSMDAIIKALYDVISGEAGKKRDWNRFRSLFYAGARMIPTGKNPKTGKGGGRVSTLDEYIEGSSPFMEKQGFFEREIARRTETFRTITHVFSTYESKHKQTDEKPFARGVNSIQLLNDGKRWWILTVAWSAESPDEPLPEKYLNNGINILNSSKNIKGKIT